MKLNGVLVDLEAAGETDSVAEFTAPGTTIRVAPLGEEEEEDWRRDAELIFELDQGLTVGYRGFYGCAAG